MIRVLSREPERSMLGLESSQYTTTNEPYRNPNLLLEGSSKGGNPARVALKGATENQLLSHDYMSGFGLSRGRWAHSLDISTKERFQRQRRCSRTVEIPWPLVHVRSGNKRKLGGLSNRDSVDHHVMRHDVLPFNRILRIIRGTYESAYSI